MPNMKSLSSSILNYKSIKTAAILTLRLRAKMPNMEALSISILNYKIITFATMLTLRLRAKMSNKDHYDSDLGITGKDAE
jgi:hypothetical protein